MKLHTDQMRVKIIKVVDTLNAAEGKLAKFRSLMYQHIVSNRDRVERAETCKIHAKNGKSLK